jgi:hypothetical protein
MMLAFLNILALFIISCAKYVKEANLFFDLLFSWVQYWLIELFFWFLF